MLLRDKPMFAMTAGRRRMVFIVFNLELKRFWALEDPDTMRGATGRE